MNNIKTFEQYFETDKLNEEFTWEDVKNLFRSTSVKLKNYIGTDKTDEKVADSLISKLFAHQFSKKGGDKTKEIILSTSLETKNSILTKAYEISQNPKISYLNLGKKDKVWSVGGAKAGKMKSTGV